MVIIDDLVEEGDVVGLWIKGARELTDSRPHLWVVGGRLLVVGMGQALAKEFDGVAEAHAFGLHDPVDDGAAFTAGAEAVPQALGGSDDEGRFFVVVKGTQAEEISAVAGKLDALGADQGGEVGVFFEAVELCLGDSGHGVLR